MSQTTNVDQRGEGLRIGEMLLRANRLLDESGEVDHHGLMQCSDVNLRRSVHLPAEDFEEAHIGHLDVGLHDGSASRRRRADCQLHEIYPDM